MEQIKAWAAGLIAMLLVTALLKFLTPVGNIKKTSNAVISIIVLILLVSPFKNTDFGSFEIPEINIDYKSMQNENTLYANAVKTAVEDALKEQSIEFKTVTVNSSLSEDGYLEIESIEVLLNDLNDTALAIDAISEKTGIERGVIAVYD